MATLWRLLGNFVAAAAFLFSYLFGVEGTHLRSLYDDYVYGEFGVSESHSLVSAWLKSFNDELGDRLQTGAAVEWRDATAMTPINDAAATKFTSEFSAWYQRSKVQVAPILRRYCGRSFVEECLETLPEEERRMLWLITRGLVSEDPLQAGVSASILSKMETVFSSARACVAGVKRDDDGGDERKNCLRLTPDIESIFETSRDPQQLLDIWLSWRAATGPKIKEDFVALVRMQNKAAVASGYHDAAAAWVEEFEMPPAFFAAELERLLAAVAPLYRKLQVFVARKLQEFYRLPVKEDEIPAHLLGSLYADDWSGVFEIVRPNRRNPLMRLTEAMRQKGWSPIEMAREAESFFLSLGLPPMTPEFWSGSIFMAPNVNVSTRAAPNQNPSAPMSCHASAHDFFDGHNYRIKMCACVCARHLRTIHHEMGHVEFFMAYKDQPAIFKNGANSAFHEAIGDTMAISLMSQPHLKRLGLSDDQEDDDKDNDDREEELDLLLLMGLEKIPFLPYAFVLEKWRYDVFQGKITPEHYNSAWWELRRGVQGVSPPVPRTEQDFDPGAKFHVAYNIPYIRYFLSYILQFQIHESLCEVKGHQGPLHRCDIHGSSAAGQRLLSALRLGASRPWRQAMETLLGAGRSKFDAAPMLRFFAPLEKWLDERIDEWN